MYHYVIDIDYYKNGSGYSHTETFDGGNCEKVFTAEDYFKNLDGAIDLLDRNGWITIRANFYDDDDDEPVASSEYDPDVSLYMADLIAKDMLNNRDFGLEWDSDDCYELCELADMLDEFESASEEGREEVVRKAAEKLDVYIG